MRNYLMLVLGVTITLASVNASASDACGSQLNGKWACDSDLLGKKIEVAVLPPGQDLTTPFFAVFDLTTSKTVLFSHLANRWSDGKKSFPVRGSCTPEGNIQVEFKNRKLNPTFVVSGQYTFWLEQRKNPDDNTTQDELNFYDYAVSKTGENYKYHETCIRF